MSKLDVGDKVKFLNQKGGGVVARILSPDMVSVAIEDGFEMPVLVSELIKIDPKDAGGRFFDEHFDVKVLPSETPEEKEEEEDLRPIPRDVTRTRKAEEIFLAFVPHDQKFLLAGMVDVCLVNNTSCDVLYNLFHKTATGHYEGVDFGSVFPDTSQVIATVSREKLPVWSDGYLQFMFHTEQSRVVLPPFNSEFRIDGKKFFKEGNFRASPMIQGRGLVVKILSLTDYLEEHRQAEEKPASVLPSAMRDEPLIFRHRTTDREAEVDLHAHELLEDTSNLERSEIIEYQLGYFRECLESALANHFMKVTFIHGVGNGILRNLLADELKKYKGIEVLDAPMSKYGVGALEVRIPHNL